MYVGFGLVLYFFQKAFIYQPDSTDFKNCTYFSESEKVKYGSTNLYFTKHSPDKVIVFYHGNAGRACDRAYLEPFFAKQGYSTVFVEYAGYGESDNSSSMSKILGNVEDTINFLKTKNFSQVVVGGEGLGVGPATYHASLASVNNVVLITAYNNFSGVVSSHFPMYPARLLLRSNYTPDKWLIDYDGPISIILAEKDEVIPNMLGKKLYEGLSSKEKSLSVIEGVGHNTIYNSPDFDRALENALR